MLLARRYNTPEFNELKPFPRDGLIMYAVRIVMETCFGSSACVDSPWHITASLEQAHYAVIKITSMAKEEKMASKMSYRV